MECPTYLIHYGIPGQKWGVRNYQNEDGTWTEEGKERRRVPKAITISKESTIYRAVRNNSNKFMDREYSYFNVTEDYYRHSRATSEGFDGEFDADYELKPIKNLKIATLDDYFYAVCKINKIDPNMYIKDIPKSVKQKGFDAVNKLSTKDKDGMFNTSKTFNSVVKELKKNGYDGFIDPVDGRYSIREDSYKDIMPTVIFDPKKNLKIVNNFKYY